MDKLRLSFLFMLVVFLLSGCKDNPEERVTDFAKRFATFANSNKTDSIKAYYKDFQKNDSVRSDLSGANVRIEMEQPAGYWKVYFGPEEYMRVLLSEDGNLRIVDSHGLFGYPEKTEALAKEKGIWDIHETDTEQAKKIAAMMEDWRKYTTPDLIFFNLHAPVKNMTIAYSDSTANIFDNLWGWAGTYNFDKDGNLINHGNIGLDASHPLKDLERTGEGEIGRLFFSSTDDWDGEADYFWEEGRPASAQSHFGSYQALFAYHPDGILEQMSYRYGNTEGDNGADILLTDYEFDEAGNWISCKWTMQRIEPVPYYSAVTGALVGYKDKVKDSVSGTMTRRITYH